VNAVVFGQKPYKMPLYLCQSTFLETNILAWEDPNGMEDKNCMKKWMLLPGTVIILHCFCTRTTVTDADGNVYNTIKIGNQIWTVENLRTTTFNDGASIPHVSDSNAWHSLRSPGYCYYANTSNADSIRTFGALYNWYCIESKKLAPQGWHIPTNDDWDTLKNYLINHGYNWDGTKNENRIAKALAAEEHWRRYQIEGTPGHTMKDNNRSGFSGLGAGYRYDTRDSFPGDLPWKASFTASGQIGAWWSATEVNDLIAYSYALSFCVDELLQYQSYQKTCGYSVRLVKNQE